ncbi:JAB domain-containing protein [Erythrobacter rubeus]|uniref:JAB domain-containing protein n=1 Tax=Erythrobacter rubeus TaxID=2760803 RepID=A0ABR8KRJ2_9SPHN|nr:JAB domain-containing protein [Erythrobacter rubeus]MBD2840806.1 JAB domain-containing protein [Erythrobacter rubeus]
MTAISQRHFNEVTDAQAAQTTSLVDYLRGKVLDECSHRERLHTIFLDRNRRYLADESMGQGSGAFLSLRMREIFGHALACGSSNLIVAHNHPSGDCRPSDRDISATRRLIEVGRALDIELIDHLIITHRSVYSMRAGGNL